MSDPEPLTSLPPTDFGRLSFGADALWKSGSIITELNSGTIFILAENALNYSVAYYNYQLLFCLELA